jgi:poly-gamma-glutamate capsule biosynthesis protein CapA/YwtB (metallophosphatase superfamily)
MREKKKVFALFVLPLFLFMGLFSYYLFSLFTPSGGSLGVRYVRWVKGEKKTQESQSKEQTTKQSVTILFAGDMMFDRYIREKAEQKGYDFLLEKMRERLVSADMTVANLEGPITSRASKSVGSKIGEARNYVFTFAPQVAEALNRNNIGLLHLGNNHILNFGQEGLEETRRLLNHAGVEYFGDPYDAEKRMGIYEIKGVKIGFVSYNQFAPNKDAVADTIEDIRRSKPLADTVVVYAHWGAEYVSAREREKALARQFVDEGADLVIGSHPHVVQESEIYRGKNIYYSLGNFIFDQYFRPETKRGLAVEATFNPETQTWITSAIPVMLTPDGRVAEDTTVTQ